MSEEKKKDLTQNLIHRDDIDMNQVENLEEFFAEKFPDMKIVFAGDQPEDELPERMKEQLILLQEKHDKSLCNGTCIDCNKEMENWPPPEDDKELDNWAPSEGWNWFTQPNSEIPMCWICPECDAINEADGVDGFKPINIEEFLNDRE